MRESRGKEIRAACGQLWAEEKKTGDELELRVEVVEKLKRPGDLPAFDSLAVQPPGLPARSRALPSSAHCRSAVSHLAAEGEDVLDNPQNPAWAVPPLLPSQHRPVPGGDRLLAVAVLCGTVPDGERNRDNPAKLKLRVERPFERRSRAKTTLHRPAA